MFNTLKTQRIATFKILPKLYMLLASRAYFQVVHGYTGWWRKKKIRVDVNVMIHKRTRMLLELQTIGIQLKRCKMMYWRFRLCVWAVWATRVSLRGEDFLWPLTLYRVDSLWYRVKLLKFFKETYFSRGLAWFSTNKLDRWTRKKLILVQRSR